MRSRRRRVVAALKKDSRLPQDIWREYWALPSLAQASIDKAVELQLLAPGEALLAIPLDIPLLQLLRLGIYGRERYIIYVYLSAAPSFCCVYLHPSSLLLSLTARPLTRATRARASRMAVSVKWKSPRFALSTSLPSCTSCTTKASRAESRLLIARQPHYGSPTPHTLFLVAPTCWPFSSMSWTASQRGCSSTTLS